MPDASSPRLLVDLEKIKANISYMKALLEDHQIELTGVVKGFSGLEPILHQYSKAQLSSIGSSRLPHLAKMKKLDEEMYTLSLRLTAPSQVAEVVEYADASLESEIGTLKALNAYCVENGRQHEVVLMVETGDLREGIWKNEEIMEAARFVEAAEGLYLKGVGTNLGCYGAILPDEKNLGYLVQVAREIEDGIGRPLDWVSGSATSSLPLMLEGRMPAGINHLRIGNGILLRDMEPLFDFRLDALNNDTFILEVEVIELKEKPSYPIGTVKVDAFSRKMEYEDRGDRMRALINVGRLDLGDPEGLIPLDEGIEIVGASSDHTILDVTQASRPIKVGDKLLFEMAYQNMLYLTQSPYIEKVYQSSEYT